MVKKIIGIVLLIIGAFFTFFPHAVHVQYGFTFDHVYHVTGGIVALVIGAGTLYQAFKKTG